jgi:hypothetical protein
MKIIYTKHARERIRKRSLSFTGVEDTLSHPDKHQYLEQKQEKFIKLQGKRLYHVVATYLPKEKSWLIVSAWVRGEQDQAPLSWRLITFPFRLIAKLFKLIFNWN